MLAANQIIPDLSTLLQNKCSPNQENQYFIFNEDPILSNECRFNQYLYDHREVICFYLYRLFGSILLVLVGYVCVISVIEVFDVIIV